MNEIAQEIWGDVDLPPGVAQYGGLSSSGPTNFINNIIRLLIIIAGIYALLNFILAGYGFLSAGGDAKKVADAWAKIWQSVIGLAVAAGAFVLAAIFGRILFGDYNALLRLRYYTP